MNHGTEVLKKLLDEMKSISTEEYLELYEIASKREPVFIITDECNLGKFGNQPSGKLENFSTNISVVSSQSDLLIYHNSILSFSFSSDDTYKLAA